MLDNIINRYKNIFHRKIKMKPVSFKLSTYIDFVSDHVRKSKCKTIFTKNNTPNQWEEVLKVKKTFKYGTMEI